MPSSETSTKHHASNFFKFNYFRYIKRIYTGYVSGSLKCSRDDFWLFFGWNCLVLVLTLVPVFYLDIPDPARIALASLAALCGVTVFLAEIGRIRDTGRNGWCVMVSFIPIIGWFWLLYYLMDDSHSDKQNEATSSSDNESSEGQRSASNEDEEEDDEYYDGL